MIKLRPSTEPTRKLVIPHECELKAEQVLILLMANGFRLEDHKGRAKLSNHSELTHHPDVDVFEQWDDLNNLLMVS